MSPWPEISRKRDWNNCSMRVLFALPHCPMPPNSGGKLLTLQAIEALSSKHELAFVVLKGPDLSEDVAGLHRFGDVTAVAAPHRRSVLHRVGFRAGYSLAALATGTPLHAYYGCPAPFWRAVQRKAEEWRPEVVHYDFWYSALRDLGSPSYRRLLLEQDVEFVRRLREAELASSARKWWLNKVASSVRRAESRVLRQVDCVMAVTPRDARVAAEVGARKVVVFPVAIDTEDRCPPSREPDAPNILFVGSFVHTPNVDGILWFAREVLPRVLSVHPSARLTIVGADPPQPVRELAQGTDRILVTGWVTDVSPYYASARVVIAPLRFGSGIKLKVLEAMSFGRPVVTTSVGAEGMDVMPGENIFVQDTPEGFAEAICVVLAYPEHARAVGLAGRALVEQQYSKEAARRKILHIYEQEADASLQTAGNC